MLELEPLIAAKAKENLKTHTVNGYQGCQKSDKAEIDTKKELANCYTSPGPGGSVPAAVISFHYEGIFIHEQGDRPLYAIYEPF